MTPLGASRSQCRAGPGTASGECSWGNGLTQALRGSGMSHLSWVVPGPGSPVLGMGILEAFCVPCFLFQIQLL